MTKWDEAHSRLVKDKTATLPIDDVLPRSVYGGYWDRVWPKTGRCPPMFAQFDARRSVRELVETRPAAPPNSSAAAAGGQFERQAAAPALSAGGQKRRL